MHTQPSQQPFTVLILGSTIPALSLALALSRRNIAFTLLERSDSLVPPETRPIALHPHGVAILDQLGVWDGLQDEAVIARGGWWAAVAQRLGYPFVFLSERRLLATLYAAIPDKLSRRCIHTSTQAVDIRTDEKGGVSVITAGMEMFACSLVVCCDRAFSTEARGFKQGEFTAYWGSAPHAGTLPPGTVRVVSEPGVSCTTVVQKPGVYWWWGVLKVPPPVTASSAYRPTEVLAAMETLGRLRQGGEEPEPVFEGVAETWWTDRTLMLGDAAYQLSPLPQLAETLALEGVAALVNALPAQAISPPPSIPAILNFFEKTHRPRVELCARLSAVLTRAATRSTRLHTFLSYYLLPRTPVLFYEEFALGSVVLNGFERQGKFWERKQLGGLVHQSKVFITGVGLWTGQQMEMVRVQLGRCKPLLERVMVEVKKRMPTVEKRLQGIQMQVSARPRLQLALGVAGLYGGVCLLGKCGGWVVRLLMYVVGGAGGGRRNVGVGVYCIPGSRYAVIH